MRRLSLVLVLAVACTGGDGGTDGGDGGEEQPGSAIDAPGLDGQVVLIAPPTEGAGEVPTFEWEPVQGAAGYRLFVVGGDGTAIWSWEGTETSVALGGLTVDRPEGAEGPVVTAGSTWSVVALDAEGHVVAVSVQRPVSP